MQTDIYLGIDLGSSSLKAVAFELGSGVELAKSSVQLSHSRLSRGECELSEPSLQQALTHVLQGVTRQLGLRSGALRAIGCTGHGAGLYALDSHGRLIGGRAFASTDQRAAQRVRDLSRQHGEPLFGDVGCRPWSGQPTLIAAALRDANALEVGAICHLLFAKDYLAYLLTGSIATDSSDASTAGLLSIHSGSWSTLAFDLLGLGDIASRALPPIVPSGTVVGTLLPAQAARIGLRASLPVAMGAIDLLASMDAVNAIHRPQVVSVFGTWCVNAAIGPILQPLPAVEAIVNFGQAQQWLYMENSPSSMANLAWLARTLAFTGTQAVIDCAMTAPLGARGLRFLPFVNGGSTPPGAGAGFVNLRSHHGREDMARAVVEAVAALHARHVERLCRFGLGTAGLMAVGGGAGDPRLVELLASFACRPVDHCGDDESGARGAALYAARSQGERGEGEACPLPAPIRRIEASPDADPSACAAVFAHFNDLIDTMTPVFAQLSEGSP